MIQSKTIFEKIVPGIIFFFIPILSFSAVTPTKISTLADSALFEILNLRTETARRILKSNNTSFDLYNEYLYNWCDVIDLTLCEDDEKYDEYLDKLSKRLDRIAEKADKSSPSYHILLAEIYVHSAMANIVYNDFFSGFRKLLKANNNARENEDLHPNFWRNNKLCGTLNVSFDMMSPVLQSFASIFGLRGNASIGFKQLNQYLEDVKEFPGLQSEGLLYYGFVLNIAKNNEGASDLLCKYVNKETSTALTIFLTSNALYKAGRNEEALLYLKYFPKQKIELPFHHYEYLLGKEKLNRLDVDAGEYLVRYHDSSHFKNYHREVCLKLAYHYYMQGNMNRYEYFLGKIDDYPKSKTNRDREADIEKGRPYPPHKEILKARFLVQGGYNSRAQEILDGIGLETLKIPGYKNEYFLLLGRVKNSQDETDEALNLFDLVVDLGKDEEEHYASEAALRAGIIYAQKNKPGRASKYFEIAMDTDCGDDVYIEIIHKKAKNLLNEIEADSQALDKNETQ